MLKKFIIRNIAVIDIRLYIKVYKIYRFSKNRGEVRNENKNRAYTEHV